MASSLRPYASIRGNPRSSLLDRTTTAAWHCILHEGTILLLVVCSVLDLKTSDALPVQAAPLGVGIQGAMYGLDDALSVASPPSSARSCTPLADPLGT